VSDDVLHMLDAVGECKLHDLVAVNRRHQVCFLGSSLPNSESVSDVLTLPLGEAFS